ncbi:RDD family protein [Aquimarina sp. W85]|uniref:RDD family protein n=1 Tax=Aquimarina rhodophyticola TaxID=3342246 RepID=UPI00366C9910
MDNFQIETAQNVSIQQNVAGVGDRILAFFIDSLFIVAYLILAVLLMSQLGGNLSKGWIVQMLISLPVFLYYVLWETLWDGRTPGKALVNLRVVRIDGSSPSFSNYLIRWLLRSVDITLGFGSVAIVTIVVKGTGQRLGDLAANTRVISERNRISSGQMLFNNLAVDYAPMYPQVTVFSDADIQKIKKIFYEARAHREQKVLQQLADRIAKVMDIQVATSPKEFIDRILEDYTYFTQQD